MEPIFDELCKIAAFLDQEGEYDLADQTEFVLKEIVAEAAKKKEKKKLDPKAKVRNRGDCVFPANSPSVKDHKDHFPLTSENQARNALARASQYKKAPPWYKGSLESLVKAVQRAVRAKYKGIKTTPASAKPGKG